MSNILENIYILVADHSKSWYNYRENVCVTKNLNTILDAFVKHSQDVIDDYVVNDDYASSNETYVRDSIDLKILSGELLTKREIIFCIGDDEFNYKIEIHEMS